MRRDTRGTLAVLAAASGYSTLPILGKLALGAGAVIWPMVAWRFLLGAVLVWAYLFLRGRPVPARRRWPALLGLGILYAGNGLAYLSALLWIPATTASLVFYTYPAAVVLLAGLLLDEPLTGRKLGALGLAVAGCSLTAGIGALAGDPIGIGLVLLAVTGLSAYITLSHPVLRELPALGASAVILSAAAVTTVVAAVTAADLSLDGGTDAALFTGLMAVTATALPVTLFLAGLKMIGAGRAAIYSTVEPVLTVVWAAVLLGERIALLQYAGGALILAGVLWLRLQRPAAGAEPPGALEA